MTKKAGLTLVLFIVKVKQEIKQCKTLEFDLCIFKPFHFNFVCYKMDPKVAREKSVQSCIKSFPRHP